MKGEPDEPTVTDEEGAFTQPGTNRVMTLREVIEAAFDEAGGANGLNSETIIPCEIISILNGCHAADVEVGPETGVVDLDMPLTSETVWRADQAA